MTFFLSFFSSLSLFFLKMARKKIREHDSKRLLREHIKRLAGLDLPLKTVQVRERKRERERERAGERGGKRKRKKNARGIDRGGRSIEKVKERNFRRFLLCFAGFFFFRGFVSGEMNTWSNDQTRRRKRGREDERMGATSDLPSPSPVVARSPGAHILDLKKNSKLQNRSSPTPTGCSSSRTTPGFRARSWS